MLLKAFRINLNLIKFMKKTVKFIAYTAIVLVVIIIAAVSYAWIVIRRTTGQNLAALLTAPA